MSQRNILNDPSKNILIIILSWCHIGDLAILCCYLLHIIIHVQVCRKSSYNHYKVL